MSTIAVLELDFLPESLAQAKIVMHRVLTETRTFDGCEGVDVFEDPNQRSRWVVFERWATVEQNAAYQEFRSGAGAVADLAGLLYKAPRIAHYANSVSV